MEELGIGCLLIYVSIVMIIQDCGYVEKEKNCLILQDKGWLVMVFLINYFCKYFEYDFIVVFENDLDEVLVGNFEYKILFGWFWCDFLVVIGEIFELWIMDVFEKINEVFEFYLFLLNEEGIDL